MSRGHMPYSDEDAYRHEVPEYDARDIWELENPADAELLWQAELNRSAIKGDPT